MRLRPALVALSATALLGLAACGGTDDSATATSSSAAGTSSAASNSAEASGGSTDPQAQTFCTDAESALSELQGQVETATPDQYATLLPQLVATLDSLEPPAEIAPAFQSLRDSYDQLAQAATSNDLTTPEGQAAFEQAANTIASQGQAAETELSSWTDANCASSSAAPTS